MNLSDKKDKKEKVIDSKIVKTGKVKLIIDAFENNVNVKSKVEDLMDKSELNSPMKPTMNAFKVMMESSRHLKGLTPSPYKKKKVFGRKKQL